LLDADWRPNFRELSLSDDGNGFLLDEHEDVATLERQIERYLAQRLG
jgi:hypothetical protein